MVSTYCFVFSTIYAYCVKFCNEKCRWQGEIWNNNSITSQGINSLFRTVTKPFWFYILISYHYARDIQIFNKLLLRERITDAKKTKGVARKKTADLYLKTYLLTRKHKYLWGCLKFLKNKYCAQNQIRAMGQSIAFIFKWNMCLPNPFVTKVVAIKPPWKFLSSSVPRVPSLWWICQDLRWGPTCFKYLHFTGWHLTITSLLGQLKKSQNAHY